MKRFEVVSGSHVNENGVKHNKGDVVESYADLDKLFVNKFKPLGEVPDHEPVYPYAHLAEESEGEASDEPADETKDATELDGDEETSFKSAKKATKRTGKWKASKAKP